MNFIKRISRIFIKENQEPPEKEVISEKPVIQQGNRKEESDNTDKPSIQYGVIVKLKIKDEIYIVEEFDLNFDQPVTAKGKRDGRPRGGIMTLVFSETLSDRINNWMQKEGATQNGEVIFYPYKSKTDESALLNIIFCDAFCIHYKKEIDSRKGLMTTLVVSPRSIKIGNEEFENIWKVSKPLSYNIKSN